MFGGPDPYEGEYQVCVTHACVCICVMLDRTRAVGTSEELHIDGVVLKHTRPDVSYRTRCHRAVSRPTHQKRTLKSPSIPKLV